MTIEDQQTTEIDVQKLIGEVEKFRNEGCRLVQVSCTKVEENFEISYSFEKDYIFRSLRIIISHDTDVPSISGMYWGAFIYENEMHDLFGVSVKGMNIDFKGTLIRTSVPYPFSNVTFKGEGPCQNR